MYVLCVCVCVLQVPWQNDNQWGRTSAGSPYDSWEGEGESEKREGEGAEKRECVLGRNKGEGQEGEELVTLASGRKKLTSDLIFT